MTLFEHLQDRLRASFRQLERALAGLDAGAARAGADPAWRRDERGLGLDGSIAGIVRHLAAWKEVAAAGLETGVFPPAGEVGPGESGWEGLLAWLRAGHGRLASALESGGEARLAETVLFDGEPMTVALVLTHLIEHDQYHAGQVNLLRQLRAPDALSRTAVARSEASAR
jgi:uncharacterized damage-inducible protein DinB